ncbi:MAG TPA: hypothetical protein VGD98_05960 [Ktedonobacteraceae bacterium]
MVKGKGVYEQHKCDASVQGLARDTREQTECGGIYLLSALVVHGRLLVHAYRVMATR